jgi:glycosyltransferase involved in cell wall biosynthesis
MNILVVTAYPPVLHMHGGGVRMYHNIRILAMRHRVRVLSFVESDEQAYMLRDLAGICDSVTPIRRIPDFRPHWLSVLPFMAREFSTPKMHRAVDDAVQSGVDVLQCEYLQMAQFHRPGVLSVLTAHEAQSKNAHEAFVSETDSLEKLRLFYRWMQMLQYEVREVRKFDRVVTMTEDDARYLKSYAPDAAVRAIPIGIDPAEFMPFDEDPNQPIVTLFIGNFRHPPNVEAARFIVERLAPRLPQIKFLIAGSHALPDLRPGSNVDLLGYIPDARSLCRRPNTIILAPLFSGSGQRVKLLEAFSMGCPVITTTVGAIGFPIEDGVQALIANTAAEFEVALRRLIQSEDERRRLGERARQMIIERFTWDRIAEDLWGVVGNGGVGRKGNSEQIPHPKNLLTVPFSPDASLPNPIPFYLRDGRAVILKKLLFPIKAVTFAWRFLVLLAWTAYLEGSRVD